MHQTDCRSKGSVAVVAAVVAVKEVAAEAQEELVVAAPRGLYYQ